MRERTGNTKRNIIYGIIQVVLSQILPFVVRTIVIYRFGVDYLGLNSLFASILNVLSLMELGFGTAVVYSLYKPVAEGDTDQICAYLGYYRKVYRVIGVAVAVVGLVILPYLRYLIHDPVIPGNLNLYVCYLLFLSDAVISYLLYGYMTAIPTAYQRRDILSRVDMEMSVLKCLLQSTLLLTSRNFYLYLLAIPIVTIIRNLIVAAVVKKRYPELGCRGTITNVQKRDLNKKIYGLFVNKLMGVSRNSIDCLCISAFIGLAMTGIYNNYYYIITAILAFSGAVCNSMMASVGNSIAIETQEKNYVDMRLFDFIYMAIATWATVCLLCLYQPFIRTWVGEKMMLDTSVVIGFSIYFFILKSGDIRWVYHEGAGLWYEARFIMIGEAVANIILNIVLCRYLGVFGIVLATVISVFITNMILCPRLIFKLYFKNGKVKEYWFDHIQYTITMLLTATTSWLLCESFLPLSMISKRVVGNCVLCLGGRLIICTGISVALFWLIWHRSERYNTAKVWMRKMIKA